MQQHIVVFGPGPRFKGGIANFTASLCEALYKQGHKVTLVSWTNQYPSIIPRDFLDKTSSNHPLSNTDIAIHYVTNFNNPVTWSNTISIIKKIKPDKIIFQWAIAIQGLPIGYIAKRIKQELPALKILFDVHNVTQKETGYLDKFLTRYALEKADGYIMHGKLTEEEFKKIFPKLNLISIEEKNEQELNDQENKSILRLYHPVYSMFKTDESFDIEAEKRKLGLGKFVFLFFGFIRKYKGLHYAIEAFSRISKKYPEASLLIVGESFWNLEDKKSFAVKFKSWVFKILKSVLVKNKGDEKNYDPLSLIHRFKIEEKTIVINRFIPNEEVYKWFMISDAVVNFYEYATPSGIESLAYQFHKPVLATRVGHFAHSIQDGVNGYLAEEGDILSMTEAMEKIIKHPIAEDSVRDFAQKLSWENYAKAILSFK